MCDSEPSPKSFQCGSAGEICVCAGWLDIIKLSKIPLIYSVSRFNLGGLGALFGGDKPTTAPRGDGTGVIASTVEFRCLQ